MSPNSLITFFRWSALTLFWLRVNAAFFAAIAQAIEDHNNTIIRRAFINGYMKRDAHNDEEASDDEEES